MVVLYCLNCLYSSRKKNKLDLQKMYVKINNFCGVVIPSEYTKILEFNQYPKSDKTPFITSDLEPLKDK